METDRLRAFCTVVETGGLREAARLLGISHGGLSKSLKVLEREVGTPLLAPSGRGVIVTDGGHRLYRAAKTLLGAVSDLPAVAAGASVTGAPLRIGTFEVFSTYFLGELVETELAGTPLSIRELVPGAIEEALVRGEIDAGITYVPIPRPELDFLRIGAIDLAVFGSRARFAAIAPEAWPFCVPAIPIHGSPTLAKGLDGWPDDELPRTVAFSADMMETALELCRRGLAVAFLPTFVARLHNRWATPAGRLESLPTPKLAARQRRDVFVVKRRASPESGALKRIARAIRRVTGPR